MPLYLGFIYNSNFDFIYFGLLKNATSVMTLPLTPSCVFFSVFPVIILTSPSEMVETHASGLRHSGVSDKVILASVSSSHEAQHCLLESS